LKISKEPHIPFRAAQSSPLGKVVRSKGLFKSEAMLPFFQSTFGVHEIIFELLNGHSRASMQNLLSAGFIFF